jgi:hypothetical protein
MSWELLQLTLRGERPIETENEVAAARITVVGPEADKERTHCGPNGRSGSKRVRRATSVSFFAILLRKLASKISDVRII